LKNMERNEAKLEELQMERLAKEVGGTKAKKGAKKAGRGIISLHEQQYTLLEAKLNKRLNKCLKHFVSLSQQTSGSATYNKNKEELMAINDMLSGNKGKQVGKVARVSMRKLLAAKLNELCPDVKAAVPWACSYAVMLVSASSCFARVVNNHLLFCFLCRHWKQ